MIWSQVLNVFIIVLLLGTDASLISYTDLVKNLIWLDRLMWHVTFCLPFNPSGADWLIWRWTHIIISFDVDNFGMWFASIWLTELEWNGGTHVQMVELPKQVLKTEHYLGTINSNLVRRKWLWCHFHATAWFLDPSTQHLSWKWRQWGCTFGT